MGGTHGARGEGRSPAARTRGTCEEGANARGSAEREALSTGALGRPGNTRSWTLSLSRIRARSCAPARREEPDLLRSTATRGEPGRLQCTRTYRCSGDTGRLDPGPGQQCSTLQL